MQRARAAALEADLVALQLAGSGMAGGGGGSLLPGGSAGIASEEQMRQAWQAATTFKRRYMEHKVGWGGCRVCGWVGAARCVGVRGWGAGCVWGGGGWGGCKVWIGGQAQDGARAVTDGMLASRGAAVRSSLGATAWVQAAQQHVPWIKHHITQWIKHHITQWIKHHITQWIKHHITQWIKHHITHRGLCVPAHAHGMRTTAHAPVKHQLQHTHTHTHARQRNIRTHHSSHPLLYFRLSLTLCG